MALYFTLVQHLPSEWDLQARLHSSAPHSIAIARRSGPAGEENWLYLAAPLPARLRHSSEMLKLLQGKDRSFTEQKFQWWTGSASAPDTASFILLLSRAARRSLTLSAHQAITMALHLGDRELSAKESYGVLLA